MCRSTENNSLIETTIAHIRDAVAMLRRRGVKTEYAIADVAQLMELTPARARSLFYRDKVWGVVLAEKARIEARLGALLDREILLSIEYTEQLRAKRNQVREEAMCEKSAQARFGQPSTGSHSISAV